MNTEQMNYKIQYDEIAEKFNAKYGKGNPCTLMKDDGIWHLKENKVTKISEPICVVSQFKSREDDTVHIKLLFKVKGIFQVKEFPNNLLVPRNLENLIDYGFPILNNDYRNLSNHLLHQQEFAPMVQHYTEVGFFEDKESKLLVFGLDEAIGASDISDTMPLVFDQERSNFNVTPAGSLDEWLKMVKEEVVGNTPLEFILSCGFSSAIVGYLYQTSYPVETLLINLTGDSTTGKTTAGMLAVSTFGAPTKKQKGLFSTWNGTSNAILQSLVGNYGVPYLIDELSMSKESDFTSFLYSITDGRNKKRLTKEISFQNVGESATTILSTGELSILSKSANNTGLKLRALEFTNVQWTTSAVNSENIKNCVMKNYGVAGKAFVQFLVKNPNYIDAFVKANTEGFKKVLVESPFRERLAAKYAIILAAAQIANEVFSFKFNVDEIRTFIVERDTMLVDSRDIGKSAWNHMLQFVQQHQNQFIHDNTLNYSHEIVGKIVTTKSKLEVSILKNVFEKAMHNFGYQDVQSILQNWKKKGLLDYEAGRLASRKQVFSKDQQEQRQEALGVAELPKKPADTVYTMLVDEEDLQLAVEC